MDGLSSKKKTGGRSVCFAGAQGGGIYCSELAYSPASLRLHDVVVVGNEALGSGGGLSLDCASLELAGGAFLNNTVPSGKGGALELGGMLRCASDPLFRDVAFKGNAAETGAVVFFSTAYPSCAVPVLEDDGSWNSSVLSAWHWTDFSASVTGNSATLGKLQATAPVSIVCQGQACQAGNLLMLEGFPGMSLSFGAMLLDSFQQMTIDDTLQVELVVVPGSTCLLDGVLQHRITQGVASIQSVKVLALAGATWSSVCKLLVRLPLSIITLRTVVPLEVHVQMGASAVTCPLGWISFRASNMAHSAYECRACPAGSFAPPGSSACVVGTSSCHANMSCPPGPVES